MLDIKRVIASAPRKPEDSKLQTLSTPWGEALKRDDISNPPNPLHPHPQFAREQFRILDGWWDYCILPENNAVSAWRDAPVPQEWDGRIRVPFSPEAPLSEVERQLKPNELLWYRRLLSCPNETPGFDLTQPKNSVSSNRCILHFEAVDYACACYCNGSLVGTHRGGYLPFSFDITDMLLSEENEIALCVYDPSDEGTQLRGKQKLARGGIWYTAQSGIWQTVWLEVVPANHLESLHLDPQADEGRLAIDLELYRNTDTKGVTPKETPLTVKLYDAGEIICSESLDIPSSPMEELAPHNECSAKTVHSLTLSVPNPHLWSPSDPHLYEIELTYGRDKVTSYCAFRSITMEEDEQGISRLCINHEPCFLRGVLDQGYWPDGLLTPPSDEALIFDIETMKALGFNMLRKHIKIESNRWYYHCDRLGMLVWQDMVCGGSSPRPWHSSYKPTLFRRSWNHYSDGPQHYRGLAAEDETFRTEWTETCQGTIDYLSNHPSIITWVLFNEAWGQFEARKATDLVRALDSTRPIDAVSGWYDQACGDFFSVHNYFRPLEVYPDSKRPKRAFVISEFGGLSFHCPKHSSLASSYGYQSYSDIESYQLAVQDILHQADKLKQQGLAGFVYTQLSDVEEETNGVLSYDRRINKLDQKDPR